MVDALRKTSRVPRSDADEAGPLIRMRSVSKHFSTSGSRIEVLDNLDLDIESAQTLAILGESGIGKSTFLHILGTLEPPDQGAIIYRQADVTRLDRVRLAAFRNQVMGFVFQFHYLLEEFSALENVMMPGLIRKMKRKEIQEAAEAVLLRVGLKERLYHRVAQLSGGEQQRVALARSLVLRPELLLADEPTGNLDRRNSQQIHELLRELNSEYGMTIVVVTHNLELADCMQRQLTLVDGKLVDAK